MENIKTYGIPIYAMALCVVFWVASLNSSFVAAVTYKLGYQLAFTSFIVATAAIYVYLILDRRKYLAKHVPYLYIPFMFVWVLMIIYFLLTHEVSIEYTKITMVTSTFAYIMSGILISLNHK